jgi:hypothetical protein
MGAQRESARPGLAGDLALAPLAGGAVIPAEAAGYGSAPGAQVCAVHWFSTGRHQARSGDLALSGLISIWNNCNDFILTNYCTITYELRMDEAWMRGLRTAVFDRQPLTGFQQ